MTKIKMTYLKQYAKEAIEFHDLDFLNTNEHGCKRLVEMISRKLKISQCPIKFTSLSDCRRASYSKFGMYTFNKEVICIHSICHEIAHHADKLKNGGFANRKAHTKKHYRIVRKICNIVRRKQYCIPVTFNEKVMREFGYRLRGMKMLQERELKEAVK